jgi:gamma-glutamyltranspeptidase
VRWYSKFPDKATPSTEIRAGKLQPYESDQTTHYSVADKYGNVVSTTYTLNLNFGSGIVASGTGILLNNEMDDFPSNRAYRMPSDWLAVKQTLSAHGSDH